MLDQKSDTRYHALDGLRASLMFLGIIIHISINYGDFPITDLRPYKNPSTSPLFAILFFLIHSFRMPLFFIIAGFFMSLLVEKRGWKKMFQNRFTRILIPLLLSFIILVPIINASLKFAALTLNQSLETAYSGSLSYLQNGEFLSELSLHHLWFLYYLMIFYVSALVLLPVLRKIPEKTRKSALDKVSSIISSPWAPVILAIITFPTLLPLSLELGMVLIDLSIIPQIGMWLAYLPFLLFGWFLHTRKELLVVFKVGIKRGFFLGLFTLMVLTYLMLENFKSPDLLRGLISVFLSSLVIWFFSFSVTGFFLKYLNKPSPFMRYMMDSSYWVYIIHFPFTMAIPGLLRHLSLSVYTKFSITLGVTLFFSFLSYHFLVRGTFVGLLLNGRKYPLKGSKAVEVQTEPSEKLSA